MSDFGGALDEYYRQQEMDEQGRIDEMDKHEQAVADRASVIAEDKEWRETALSDAAIEIGDEERKQRAREWDAKWSAEIYRAYKATTKRDTGELMEAAQGIGELMQQAIDDLAEREIDSEKRDAA